MLISDNATGKAAVGNSESLSVAGVDVTPRESEILARITKGHTSKEIARVLNISSRTVEFHRANLLRKFDAKSTAHLLRKTSVKS